MELLILLVDLLGLFGGGGGEGFHVLVEVSHDVVQLLDADILLGQLLLQSGYHLGLLVELFGDAVDGLLQGRRLDIALLQFLLQGVELLAIVLEGLGDQLHVVPDLLFLVGVHFAIRRLDLEVLLSVLDGLDVGLDIIQGGEHLVQLFGALGLVSLQLFILALQLLIL